MKTIAFFTNLIALIPQKAADLFLCLIEEVGVTKMETFIQERMQTVQVNIWAIMQKVGLQTWSASLKNVHVAISNKVLELKEDRGLFARIAANSRPETHLQECLSNYELSIVPRSLFATDDTVLFCQELING